MRRLWLLLLALLTAAGCATTGSSHGATEPDDPTVAATASGAPGVHCGYVRWAVKTGTDPLAAKINPKPVVETIDQLRHLPAPYDVNAPGIHNYRRFVPAETVTVRLHARLVAYAVQQDGDYHLVLVDDHQRSIIAEIPNPACVKGGPLAAGITAARAAFSRTMHYNPPPVPAGHYSPGFVTANRQVTVVGVVFFDSVHGQHGVAPNGVELHPLIAFH